MKPIHLSFVSLGTLVLASTTFETPWLAGSQRWIRSIVSNEFGNLKTSDLERDVNKRIALSRNQARLKHLEADTTLQKWLAEAVASGTAEDLDALSASLQSHFPQYVKVVVSSMKGLSPEELLDRVSEWSSHTEASYNHQAIVTTRRSAHLGFECVIVLGERLPDFKPELISRGHEKFFILCPFCHGGQACEIPSRMRSVSLECPRCHQPYAMLAVDTKGRFHHVNQFLTGYAPPAHFARGTSRLKEMMQIWDRVVHGIVYLPDSADGNEDNDAWQTALETQRLGTGDCEDSAIYLTDWLNARGFEARVAVGHYAERGGHAWVVVRLDGKTYLLETTNLESNTQEPPLASDVGARYVPDATIDRTGFYSRSDPTSLWDGDYWSPRKWKKVVTQNSAEPSNAPTTPPVAAR